MNQTVTLRSASPSEIDVAIAIDDAASTLYETVGIRVDPTADDPFAVAEHDRWRATAANGGMFFAMRDERPVGLLVFGRVDDAPYLEQLSVHPSAMRSGIGRRLLREAVARANGAGLWLTTYAHVPWTRPFYEREGFVVVPESSCGPQVRAILAEERRWLPEPQQRVAMRR